MISKQNLTQTDNNDNNDVRSQFEKQLQNQELEDSGWRFDKTNSMTKSFHKFTEMNESSCLKFLLLR